MGESKESIEINLSSTLKLSPKTLEGLVIRMVDAHPLSCSVTQGPGVLHQPLGRVGLGD